MFAPRFREGQHVVTTHDLHGWLGSLGAPTVRKGTRGIIRGREGGKLRAHYDVEFANGSRLGVDRRHLRRALLGHGEDAWRRHKANRAGIRIGLALLALPGLFELAKYYLHGGSTAGLIAAMPGAVTGLVAELGGRIVGLLGLPLTVVLVAIVWLLHRRRL